MKRTLAILLIALMATICAFGNGQNEEAAQTASVEVSAPGTFPITQEMTELTLFKAQSEYVKDYETNALTEWLEELTNVHINFMLAPSADVTQKINLILASGSDLPDVFNGEQLGNDLLAKYGDQGIFLPLNDMIEEHMVELKVHIDKHADLQVMKQIALADGTIYALPRFDFGCEHCFNGKKLFMNASFLEAVGMETPTTTDELYEVLKAFKENDVNGNGDPSDEIPMAGAKNGWGQTLWDNLMNSFQYYDEKTKGFSLDNGKIYASYTREGWREGLRYMQMLVEEGLLDPTTFTMDNKQHRQLYFKNDANTIGAFTGGSFAAYRNPETLEFFYEPVEPLTGPSGQKYASWVPYNGVQPGKFAITSSCENPEVAIKWADVFYSDESNIRSRFGVEDVDWEKAPEGTIGANGNPAIYTILVEWNTIQNSHWHAENIAYMSTDWTLGQAIEGDPNLNYPFKATDIARTVYQPYNPPIDLYVPPLTFSAEEYDEMADMTNTINDYWLESLSRFIVGDLDLDTDWDAYLDELEKMGLPKLISMHQAAYDRQWK